MHESIRSVFGEECHGLHIDAKLLKRLHAYQVGFVNKNDDHIVFFGGHLLGVQVVRFTPADQDRWFDEILEADPTPLETRLLALPDVNENFIVSSNTMNLSCAWLKVAIKQYGNWYALLRARAEAVIDKESIHYNTIAKMDKDLDVTYLLSDTQGRIRDLLKNIYGVFMSVHKQGIKISSTSGVVEHDGQEILKDKTKSVSAYGRYLNAIVTDKQTFMREE